MATGYGSFDDLVRLYISKLFDYILDDIECESYQFHFGFKKGDILNDLPLCNHDGKQLTSIQRYHSSDKDNVMALWKLCDLARSNGQSLHDIQACIRSSSSELLVGRSDKMLVGTAMVGCNWAAGWVYYLAVHPEWRLNGIGGRLMRHSEAWAKEQGVLKIWVEISPSHLIARGFYRCLGFQNTSSFIMQKFLK